MPAERQPHVDQDLADLLREVPPNAEIELSGEFAGARDPSARESDLGIAVRQ
jgi:hypothetical protein